MLKKTKLTIINKSELPLQVTCKNCGFNETNQLEVKKKYKGRLYPGRYNVMFYYDCANLKLESNVGDFLEVGDIPCPHDQKFTGKMIVLNYPKGPIRVKCEDKFSVVNYIQNGN